MFRCCSQKQNNTEPTSEVFILRSCSLFYYVFQYIDKSSQILLSFQVDIFVEFSNHVVTSFNLFYLIVSVLRLPGV